MALEPYCIREFKNRWYLYAHKAGMEGPHIYALDRMLTAEVGEKSFKMPSKFDPADYFSGVYGVRVYHDMKPEFVTLKATAMQANYFRSLPLHSSQEEIERTEEYSLFKYFLTPDYDFKQDILSFGASVEILSPAHLREETSSTVNQLFRMYNEK